MDLNLRGKTAIVTGASWGIGREIALTFAQEGAHVLVHYHTHREEAEGVVAEARSLGVRALAFQADITDGAQVDAMVKKVLDEFGRVDILINNAGWALQQPFPGTSRQDWEKQIDVSLYGILECCRAVVGPMMEQKGGKIVSIITDAARVGQSRMVINATARAGVIGMSKSLARELGRYGINVNVVALGWIRTPATAPYLDQWGEEVVKFYPLRRLGTPRDAAPAVVFLASDAASWITGQVLAVNGGYSMVG
jgi:3-oxoacyl-[acyl-carrier protein] reductase